MTKIFTDGEEDAGKQFFEQGDADMDNKLNKEETLAFLKKITGESVTDDFLQKWHAAIASLNTTTGDSIEYVDFQRSVKVIRCWLEQPQKAMDAAMQHMPPEAKAMMQGFAGMMGGP